MAEKKTRIVKFHTEIYTEAAVKAAAAECAGFASFNISRKGHYIRVMISPASTRLQAALAYEFANRALFNSK